MRIVLTSPSLFLNQAGIDKSSVESLIDLANKNCQVIVISCKAEPDWFSSEFSDSKVQFYQMASRQNGSVIDYIAKELSVNPYEILVVAATQDDLAMAKNGGAMLLAAGWSTESRTAKFGVKIDNPKELEEVIRLLNGWSGHWWAEAITPKYNIYALSDLSSFYKEDDQVAFSKKITNTVKNGGGQETALLTICSRSLLIDEVHKKSDLLFGVYPSSNSKNDDSEVLSNFTHRLRTTVSQVQFARKDNPLFFRHTPSIKRSASKNADRLDPSGQIETIHINPFYKNRLKDRNVILVDDCTTFGASFAVAAAFLLKGGAKSVTGIALGKFGNQLHYFDISIDTDPFKPVVNGQYRLSTPTKINCKTSSHAQTTMIELL